MNFEETFPLRYYINLGRRQDRRIETEIGLAEAGISASRFPAVDARFVRNNRGYDSAGRYALALSQRLAIRQAMLKKADAVLIFEDDVTFHPEFLKRLEEIEIPDDWGIFFLGCSHFVRPKPTKHAGLVRATYPLTTHAFAVRAPYYQRVISELSIRKDQPRNHPGASDWYLADLASEIPTYACYPNLAWQAQSYSDLEHKHYSPHDPAGKQRDDPNLNIGLDGEMLGIPPWVDRSDSRHVTEEVRPALLFLTRGEVNHADVWEEYLIGNEHKVSIHVHPKHPELVTHPLFRNRIVPTLHDTRWGHVSLVRSMLSLLQEALKDPRNTHFVFLSESCVPVKPLASMLRSLSADSRSRFWHSGQNDSPIDKMERMKQSAGIPEHSWSFHSQWLLLNREAATCIAEADLTFQFEEVLNPEESYFGTVLHLRGYPVQDRVVPTDPVWTRWLGGPHPESIGKVNGRLGEELALSPSFFARKFLAHSDVGALGLHLSPPAL